MINSPKIWNYNENEEQQIDTSLTWTPTCHFYEDIAVYAELQQIALHPCFRKDQINPELPLELNTFDSKDLQIKTQEDVPGDPNQPPVVEDAVGGSMLDVEEEPEPEVLNMFTKKIDKSSIQALFAVLPHSKINTLKFSNNGFEYLNLKMLINLLPTSNITRLFIDWNEIPKSTMLAEESESLLSTLLDHIKLECLYLRASFITDAMIGEMVEKLKEHPSLVCLDLSRNPLTRQGIQCLADLLQTNTVIQYLGLASINNITVDDLEPLIQVLGKNPFPAEEVENQLKLMKDRDAIIEKNKKAKGKKEEAVPEVENIEQVGEDWFVWKNTTLKHINLALNGFDENSLPTLTRLLDKTPETFGITVTGTPISRDTVKVTILRFGDRIIL